MKRFSFVLLVVGALLATISISNAGSAPEIDRAAAAISHDLMSPFCPGLLLSDCRSDAAAALRADIHARLEAGQSEGEVRQDLEELYGEKIRAAPAVRGFGLVAWVVPFVTLAIGAGLAMRWIGANRASARTGVVRHEVSSPQNRTRLDEELSQAGLGRRLDA